MFVTIDSVSTRNLDVALAIQRLDDGYRLQVAIADPTEAVPLGSELDARARQAAASQYVRDATTAPMLPISISEGEGSLIAGAPRPALVFQLDIDSELNLANVAIEARTVTVGHRLTYADIPTLIQQTEHPAQQTLAMASHLATRLLERRHQKGALALFDLKRGLLTDENGNLHQYTEPGAAAGHLIVQEFMILANGAVAQYMAEHDVPAISRPKPQPLRWRPSPLLRPLTEGPL